MGLSCLTLSLEAEGGRRKTASIPRWDVRGEVRSVLPQFVIRRSSEDTGLVLLFALSVAAARISQTGEAPSSELGCEPPSAHEAYHAKLTRGEGEWGGKFEKASVTITLLGSSQTDRKRLGCFDCTDKIELGICKLQMHTLTPLAMDVIHCTVHEGMLSH